MDLQKFKKKIKADFKSLKRSLKNNLESMKTSAPQKHPEVFYNKESRALFFAQIDAKIQNYKPNPTKSLFHSEYPLTSLEQYR